MLKFKFTPQITTRSAVAPFVQRISAIQGQRQVATAIWYAPVRGDLAQLLNINVDAKLSRRGIGSALLAAVYAQSQRLSKSRAEPIKRFWCVVEHERDIVGRAFLFKHGYHHITTPKRLYRGGQDPMIYVKAFD